MKVNIEELSPILKKVSVEVPPEDVNRALDRAYREANRNAKIPGFRPGKVPRWMLERHYRPQVTMQVAEDLVRDTWPKVAIEEKIRAAGMPEIEEVGTVEKDKPFDYKAKVEVLPEPKVSEFEGLEGERPKVEVTNEDIEGELERIQKSFARLVPVEDRTKVETGDYVVAEVSATADGEPFETGKEDTITLEVSAGDISGGHIPEAEGHEIGSTVKTRYDFPDEERYPPHLRGKTGKFEVKIQQIKKREVPPIDDELARDLGEEGVDSLLALRGLIREKLTERRNKEADLKLTDSLMKALVEKNPIEVPSSLIDRATASMVQPFFQQLAQSGAAAGELGSEKVLKRLLETSRPRAEATLKSSMLLEAVADKVGIEVKDEDLDEYYEELSKEEGAPVEKIRAQARKDPEEQENTKRRVRERKALAHVREKATIKEVDGGLEQDGEGEPKDETSTSPSP